MNRLRAAASRQSAAARRIPGTGIRDRAGVPAGEAWFDGVKKYERDVLAKRA